jgi:hypothetical protein
MFMVGLRSLALLTACVRFHVYFLLSPVVSFGFSFATAKPYHVVFLLSVFSGGEFAHSVILILHKVPGSILLSWLVSTKET